MKHPSHKLKVGCMVTLRHDRLIADDSMMPLWTTPACCPASIDIGIDLSTVPAWMGYTDIGVIVEIAGEELPGYRYTPIVKLLLSSCFHPNCGWIDSIYLREIK
jgi:hypothetical protein